MRIIRESIPVILAGFLVATLAGTSPLAAQEADPASHQQDIVEAVPHPGPPVSPNVIGIGVKAGLAIPQIASEFDTSFAVHIDLTYLMPFWGSRFGLYTAIGFSMPEASGSGQDPRLPGGEYTWTMTQRQTIWDIGLTLRAMEWASPWNLAFKAGYRMTFVSTLSDGTAGDQVFGRHDERGNIPGAFASVQGEYRLGPGALFGELLYGIGIQDLRTSGDLALSELFILVGYRFDIPF
jgi:hypothetical protein